MSSGIERLISILVKIFKVLLALFVLIPILIALSPIGFYFYGLTSVRDNLDPPTQLADPVPLAAYQKWLGLTEDSEFKKLSPYSFVFGDFPSDAAMDLYKSGAGISLYVNDKDQIDQYTELAQASALVYVSKVWSVDQIATIILQEAYFGRGATGVASASQLYFGRSPSELSESELFALFSLPDARNKYSLWCDTNKHVKYSNQILKDRGVTHTESELQLLPMPEGACEGN